jgi:hypothetical protein
MHIDVYYEILRRKVPLRRTKAEVRITIKRILIHLVLTGFTWIRYIPVVDLWEDNNETLDQLIKRKYLYQFSYY